MTSPVHFDRKENLEDSWNRREVASRLALEAIKTKASAGSWDHANELQKSVLINEIWWLAHNALASRAA